MLPRATKRLITNTIEGSLLLCLVLAAVYVSAGRILIANIDNYRSSISNMIGEQIGVPVVIERVSGGWSYLDPEITVTGFRIGGAASGSLSFGTVSVGIDAVATLLEGELIIQSLTAEGVTLALAQVDGRWGIHNLPRGKTPPKLNFLVESLSYINELSLKDLDIQVLGRRNEYRLSSNPEQSFELARTGELRTLSLPLVLEYTDEPDRADQQLWLAGQYHGSPMAEDFEADFFLEIPQIDATEIMPAQIVENLKLENLAVNGKFWFLMDGTGIQIRGLPEIQPSFQRAGKQVIGSTSLRFAAEGDLDEGLDVTLAALTGSIAGTEWALQDLNLSVSRREQGLVLAARVPELSIDAVTSLALGFGRSTGLISTDQINVIETINPRGTLRDLMLVLRAGVEEPEFKLTAKLDEVAVDQYKGVPAVSLINGLLVATEQGGYVDLNNETPFEIHFASVFDVAWPFDSGHTRLYIERKPWGILAYSTLVELTKGDLLSRGRVVIRLPADDPMRHTWALEIGVKNAPLLEAYRYLPNTMNEDVVAWMKRSVLDGWGTDSGMVFHGSLARIADKAEKVHELYFRVEDAVLDYDPAWPRFDDLSATIYVGNRSVSSHDAVARVMDARIPQASVLVPISLDAVVDSILIDGELEGPFRDGLRLLTQTPLFDLTKQVAGDWYGDGEMSGRARLNIPMGPRALAGEPVLSDVDITVAGVDMFMPGYDLALNDVSGQFNYETDNALTSTGFTATLLDKVVTGAVTSEGDRVGGEIQLQVEGPVDVKRLMAWSRQPILSQAEGDIDYTAVLYIPYGDRSDQPIYVNTTSTLEGVAINLPPPMTKQPGQAVNYTYRQTFLADSQRIELSIEELFDLNVKVVGGVMAGGRIHFGHTPPGAVTYDLLQVTGNLEKVVYEDWYRVVKELEGKSENSLSDQLSKTLDDMVLDIGKLDVLGFELEDVRTRITRRSTSWHVELANELVEGVVRVMDDSTAPLELDMARLSFATDQSNTTMDPLLEVDPSNLALARVSLNKLQLDGEDYGSWVFDYVPREHGGQLKNLRAFVKGLSIDEGAVVNWQLLDGVHLSSFQGDITVPKLGKALELWGFASSIKGDDFEFTGDVSWPGSPAMINLQKINGTVVLEKGSGSFVQADSNVGALKMLGIFDFASLMRRFRFDFSDVVEDGFSFTEINGTARFSSGLVDVVEPIRIEGSGSIFKVAGRINLNDRSLDNDMIVTLPVNRNLPWYAAYSAIVTGPLAGAGVYLAQKLFQNQIESISSAKYKVTGTIDEPVIEFVSMFTDEVREVPTVPTAEKPQGE